MDTVWEKSIYLGKRIITHFEDFQLDGKKYWSQRGWKKDQNGNNIQAAGEFFESEKIVRSIFSPINLKKDGTGLNPNAFRSPAGIDEVSVNRLSYTNADFCKRHGKSIENPSAKRSFFGLALLYVNQILSTGSEIKYTPKPDNIYHADIKIGFIPVTSQPLPPQFQKKVRELAEKSKLFRDNNPSSNSWGGSLIE